MIEHHRRDSLEKLEDALWAYMTVYKIPIRTTPYRLIYRKACRLPTDLEHKTYCALKILNFDLNIAAKKTRIQVNELDEWHLLAYKNSKI